MAVRIRIDVNTYPAVIYAVNVVYTENTFMEEIQLSNLVSGIYIISLYFNNKILTTRFTVL